MADFQQSREWMEEQILILIILLQIQNLSHKTVKS